MPKLIICNWKENPSSLKEALLLAEASDAKEVAIAPPFPFLGAVRAVVKKAALAAQDVSHEEQGAFTGAVSASQLSSVGVRYVIVGHSERRRAGDTDDIVAKKVYAVIHAGLTPILCVGETREEHDEGNAQKTVGRQLQRAFSLLAKPHTSNLLIAYEPVWAISTEPNAEPDTPESAVSMIKFIEKSLAASGYSLKPMCIYGGSINPANAESFLKEQDIEGALVGHASLRKEDIKKIIEIAKRY